MIREDQPKGYTNTSSVMNELYAIESLETKIEEVI